ncbi:phage tail terminator family protein [Oscillospiraceae bacterium LTW-04]|nr:hypothetical protein RBH76_12065 [Oscillospiraceae bacterium MB24-C1]
MAIIFDSGLLTRREAKTLTPADLCKIALCSAVAVQLPGATVYASAQAQGVVAPAVFVRFGKIAAREKLGGVEQVVVEAQCRYLPLAAEDDGENETAMQAMLDALLAINGGEADFSSRNRTAERTELGATTKGEIRLEIRRKDAAELAEGIMRTLELGVQAG